MSADLLMSMNNELRADDGFLVFVPHRVRIDGPLEFCWTPPSSCFSLSLSLIGFGFCYETIFWRIRGNERMAWDRRWITVSFDCVGHFGFSECFFIGSSSSSCCCRRVAARRTSFFLFPSFVSFFFLLIESRSKTGSDSQRRRPRRWRTRFFLFWFFCFLSLEFASEIDGIYGKLWPFLKIGRSLILPDAFSLARCRSEGLKKWEKNRSIKRKKTHDGKTHDNETKMKEKKR